MADKLQMNVRIDPDLDRAIEDYRKKFGRIPTRTDAVIALLWRGLNCTETDGPDR
jgi:hypothetical protein